ncbi:MAG TPA: hypothetical protein VI731_03365, partial [Bacteroidia bacterium]|nr:hypothetical protein [Bacteroidia bacterium]
NITIVIEDPEKKYFGDTLFKTMKLVEVPGRIVSCGNVKYLQVFKFELQWFDNEIKRKEILLYIECPQALGSNFYSPGAEYIITAIPLTNKLTEGKQVYTVYGSQQLETYYCLRIRRVGN